MKTNARNALLVVWSICSLGWIIGQFTQPVAPGLIAFYGSFELFAAFNLALCIAGYRKNGGEAWRPVYMYGLWVIGIAVNLIRTLSQSHWSQADTQMTTWVTGTMLAILTIGAIWHGMFQKKLDRMVMIAALAAAFKATPQFVIAAQVLAGTTTHPVAWLAIASGHLTICIRVYENWQQYKVHKGVWAAPLLSEAANEVSWIATSLAQVLIWLR